MSLAALLEGLEIIESRDVTVGKKTVTLHARELSGEAVESLLDGVFDADGNTSRAGNQLLRNRLVAASICDAAGSPITDVETVAKQVPARLLKAMHQFAMDVNGFDESPAAEKKDQPGG